MSPDDLIVDLDIEEVEVIVEDEAEVDLIVTTDPDIIVSTEVTADDLSVEFEIKEVDILIEDEIPEVDLTVMSAPDIIILATNNVGSPGPAGPPGPASTIPGPMGPAGPGASTYIHNQITLAATWVITHNLGWFPAVSVVDTGGSLIEPSVIYNSDDQITLEFGAATSGKAYLNPGPAGGIPEIGYLHEEAVAALTWTVTHNLERFPSVTVSDVDYDYVLADVHYINENSLTITFEAPTAGRAYLV